MNHWNRVEKYVERPQYRHDLMLHCYRTTFTDFLRALPPFIFQQTDLSELIASFNQTNAEHETQLPNVENYSVCLADYIDNWMQRIGITITGLYYDNVSIDDKDELKLIKMDPGVSVPLHSHGGKEYILVLEGSFCDEYGEYSKGDIQINDQKIKHTPIASKDTGCICLSITEKDVIFFGKYGSFLNLFTFIKSFFKQK